MRDSATASKILVLVSIDEFQWIDYTDGRVALQKIHGIKSGFALDVDQVAEVPADQIIDSGDGAGGYMPSVVGIFRRNDGLGDVAGGELFGFVGHRHEGIRGERIGK